MNDGSDIVCVIHNVVLDPFLACTIVTNNSLIRAYKSDLFLCTAFYYFTSPDYVFTLPVSRHIITYHIITCYRTACTYVID